ncbi:thioredoxin-like protein [Gilbertella persicaria]|uniref:thioredoxin-like protein n=1 Tax=Gilbertella persicaria TaxID=101096 RepID=UPI00221FDEDD|nr:thioredoxin-like protein [Gilbertella persicaria]KAI8097877.1 thioredoxin-like protein [Gilbertella persicaria]
MSDTNISKFCDITGASAEIAQQFLEIADNNFETAVTLFLENGGGTTHSRPVSIHSDKQEPLLADEELARQIQESENSHEVRAPIAPKTDILAGPSSDMFHQPSSSFMWNPQREQSRPSIFNQGDSTTGSMPDFFERLNPEGPSRSSTGSPEGVSPVTSKAKRLADLFRPPFDIMFKGNFEEARESAKEKNKWLMINVQDPTEFACQVMNRDLWSDSFVKDIIRESFVFLQYAKDSADGKRYHTYYSISGFPHLAIIDARTGERVKVWEKQLSATDFMMDITEFLEQNSSTRAMATMKRPRVQKNISDMTEEEQLNAAIAASLNGSTESTQSTSPQTMEVDSKEKEKHEEEVEEKAGSAFDGIKAVEREETTDMTNSTRIQLRMGDGSRIIRRFLKSDPVRYLFEFIKAEVPEAANQPFELVFNRTQLIDVLDQTIEEAGLSNAAVNCVFI